MAAAEQKAEMMQRIIREAGPGTRAGAVVFSLPVTDTAGMALRPQSEELEEDTGETPADKDADDAESGGES